MLRQLPKVVLVFLALFTASYAQSKSYETSVREYSELRSRLREMEKSILRPSDAEVRSAEEKGLKAIRLMPREKYEHSLTIRGGGAYYSFARLDQEYNYGSDIELQRDHLSVGFAGLDYGFMYDLGDIDLLSVEKESGPAQFLARYEPPANELAIRAEQRKSHNYEADGFAYNRRLPAVVGHTYLLRSINIAESDVLIALKIARKDSDGSLIIFWKSIERFKKPEIARRPESSAP